jgi:ABC-type nitrate/sulfonate/bicarbonate transport system ATPase subunit
MPSAQRLPVLIAEGRTAFQVRDLRKSFTSKNSEPRCVLNGISFSIDAGEILGIFGPSGCGKTTLLRILSGVSPYEGEVLLFDVPVWQQRGAIAYVPQRAELLYWKTLLSNALLGWSVKTHARRQDPAMVERARALFNRFRLLDAEQKYPHQSSGGECQRTALIRALLTPSEVLALDEPVGAVDYIGRVEIYQTLLDLVVESNLNAPRKTLVMVSHDPEELLFLCDRVLVLPKVATDAVVNVSVPFVRPRTSDVKFTPDFVDRKRFLWSLLK